MSARRKEPGVPPAVMRQLASLAADKRYVEMEATAVELTRRYRHAGVAWKALSVAQLLQGKDAVASSTEAARWSPADIECHSNLGAALRTAGRAAEAVRSYERALRLRPDNAPVWNNLGNALTDTGRLIEAAAAFRRAIELQPNFVQAHDNLGNALKDLGLLDDAMAAYRRALECDPRYATAQYHLAAALRYASRPHEAEQACRYALELEPGLTAARVLLGDLYADRGRFAAAEEVYRRAHELDPQSAPAWAGLVELKRMTLADSWWASEAERILGTVPPPSQEAPLRYALGKYFDDVGEYARAFDQFRRANDLAARMRPPHDRVAVSAGIDALIETYEAASSAGGRTSGNPSERPVFIVGMPRSGTTLAEQILAAHADVAGVGELPFWNTAARRLAAEPERLARLAEEYLRELQALAPEAQRVVDKMPGNFLYLGLIHAALPQARFIHVRRHPIDTCMSIYFQNFGPAHTYANDLDDLAHYYTEYQRLIAYWRNVLPASTLLDVSYEDLVTQPDTVSRRMVEFIGLPWDPRCLDFHQAQRVVSTFSKWQARQPINSRSVGRFRNYEAFLGPLRRLV